MKAIIQIAFRYMQGAVVWTCISFSIIAMLSYAGLNPYLSNFFGYVVGLILSFFVQKFWIFQIKTNTKRQVILFIGNFALAFLANLCALWAFIALGFPVYFGHAAGAVVYSLVFFLVSRSIVFR